MRTVLAIFFNRASGSVLEMLLEILSNFVCPRQALLRERSPEVGFELEILDRKTRGLTAELPGDGTCTSL